MNGIVTLTSEVTAEPGAGKSSQIRHIQVMSCWAWIPTYSGAVPVPQVDASAWSVPSRVHWTVNFESGHTPADPTSLDTMARQAGTAGVRSAASSDAVPPHWMDARHRAPPRAAFWMAS